MLTVICTSIENQVFPFREPEPRSTTNTTHLCSRDGRWGARGCIVGPIDANVGRACVYKKPSFVE